MRKSTKEKIFRKVQKVIQDTYMLVFGATLFDMLFLRFIPMKDVNFLSIAFVVSTILTISKGLFYLRTPKHRKEVWEEIKRQAKSENGIYF